MPKRAGSLCPVRGKKVECFPGRRADLDLALRSCYSFAIPPLVFSSYPFSLPKPQTFLFTLFTSPKKKKGPHPRLSLLLLLLSSSSSSSILLNPYPPHSLPPPRPPICGILRPLPIFPPVVVAWVAPSSVVIPFVSSCCVRLRPSCATLRYPIRFRPCRRRPRCYTTPSSSSSSSSNWHRRRLHSASIYTSVYSLPLLYISRAGPRCVVVFDNFVLSPP